MQVEIEEVKTLASAPEVFMAFLRTRHRPLVVSVGAVIVGVLLLNATHDRKSLNPAAAKTSRNPLVANKAKKTSTPQPSAAPARGKAKDGYLGLATVTDDEDQIRVMMVVAGGPAAKAGVRRGDVVRELNGRLLRSNDELVPAMRGPVGSKVKLLLARENEEGDYNPITVTITRGAMPGTTTARTGGTAAPHGAARPMPANQPNVVRPNVNGAGGSPRAVAGFPAFLKPGARLVYNEGDSVVHGVTSKLVPSPDGKGWIDPQGRIWKPQDNRNSGGMAYVTIDIVHADRNFIAADARSYLLGVEGYPVTSGGYTLKGNANAFGGKTMSAQFDYWIAPARLAKMRQGRLGTEKNQPHSLSNRWKRLQCHQHHHQHRQGL
jgi:membrane-associated protease RseP (regulator of RpoE activity)